MSDRVHYCDAVTGVCTKGMNLEIENVCVFNSVSVFVILNRSFHSYFIEIY